MPANVPATMIGVRRDNPDSLMPVPGQYGKDCNGEWFGVTPRVGQLAILSAAMLAAAGPVGDAGFDNRGLQATDEARARKAAERKARAATMVAKAEAKRERRRLRNLATVEPSNG